MSAYSVYPVLISLSHLKMSALSALKADAALENIYYMVVSKFSHALYRKKYCLELSIENSLFSRIIPISVFLYTIWYMVENKNFLGLNLFL